MEAGLFHCGWEDALVGGVPSWLHYFLRLSAQVPHNAGRVKKVSGRDRRRVYVASGGKVARIMPLL